MQHFRSNSGSGADAKVESTVLDVLVVLIEEMDQPTADIIDLIAEKLIFATVRSSPPAVTVCARTFKAVTPSRPFLSVLLACAARRLRPMRKASNAAAHFIMRKHAVNRPVPHAVLRTIPCSRTLLLLVSRDALWRERRRTYRSPPAHSRTRATMRTHAHQRRRSCCSAHASAQCFQADVAQYIHDLKDGRLPSSDLRPKLHALMEAFNLVRCEATAAGWVGLAAESRRSGTPSEWYSAS